MLPHLPLVYVGALSLSFGLARPSQRERGVCGLNDGMRKGIEESEGKRKVGMEKGDVDGGFRRIKLKKRVVGVTQLHGISILNSLLFYFLFGVSKNLMFSLFIVPAFRMRWEIQFLYYCTIILYISEMAVNINFYPKETDCHYLVETIPLLESTEYESFLRVRNLDEL